MLGKIKDSQNNLSLSVYLLIVFALSWPFQFFIFIWPESTWAFKMLLVSMVMVTIGTIISAKIVFKDSLSEAGWSWGRPIHYLAALVLPILVWIVPTIYSLFLGPQTMPINFNFIDAFFLFLTSFVITLIPAFGEEFGWRGYLLPRLVRNYSIKKALLIQAFIWWGWHLPVLVFSGMTSSLIKGNVIFSIMAMLAISIIPSMMHAIVFSYFWTTSNSLVVVTVYHSAFDEIRDTAQSSVGLGPLVEIWQMILLTIVGLIFLWKVRWAQLKIIQDKYWA